MSQLSLGFQALYTCSRSVNALEPAVEKDGHAQCTGNTSREPGTVSETARRPHFSLAFISVTVQIRIQVFWVISVYFNLGNILPNSDTFHPGHPIYIYIYIQQGLVLRRGYVLEYLIVNKIVVKRVLFKWFKLRQVHGPNKSVK